MFPCSKCGSCCKHIAKVISKYDRGDGVCINLSKNNLCMIYDHRPFICNIDKIYNTYFVERITKKEFYELTDVACEIVRELEG